MSEAPESAPVETNVRRLAEAVREVKNALADRDDVVVELREAERMRLELLAQELEGVAADAPTEHPGFDLSVSSGVQPRYWVDAVAHVAMGRDKRTYRFVRDTRLGRVVIAETTDMKTVANAVTRYVAERIIERQHALETGQAGFAEVRQAAPAQAAPARPARPGQMQEALSSLAFMVLGMLVGVAVTLAALRDRVPELTNLFSG
jgi:hypothetical protein